MRPNNIKTIASVTTICFLFILLAFLHSLTKNSSISKRSQVINNSLYKVTNRNIADNIPGNTNDSPVTIDASFFEKLANVFPMKNEKTEQDEIQDFKSKVTAIAYIVGNLKTGEIYLEKRADLSLPVASMSKLLTASVAMDLLPRNTITQIDENTIKTVPNNKDDFKPGERFATEELIPLMLVSSSNIAAEAIASTTYMNREEFVHNMSAYSWEVGVRSSYFSDPSGISEYNRVSARDIFSLSKYLYERKPEILNITKIAKGFIEGNNLHNSHVFASTHPYVSDKRFLGGKTGTTIAAGETMLTILSIKGEPISFVVLHSKAGNRKNDTDILIKLVSNRF